VGELIKDVYEARLITEKKKAEMMAASNIDAILATIESVASEGKNSFQTDEFTSSGQRLQLMKLGFSVLSQGCACTISW
jgi:hypothetical protein